MATPGTSTAEGGGNALPAGTRLGEYELRGVIGVGGFGIVYLAYDHGLQREVAIKEYMPTSLAARTANLHVSLTSPSHAETFALGLRSFVNEARMLARFDHRSLIKVHRFWEDRGTAYMVMPLLRGRTLREVRRDRMDPPDEPWLRGIVEPLLGALAVLHNEDVFHRDIAPDNILIGEDGVPMLLDFGAARHVISGHSQTLTAILKPNYAPIEQYGEAGSLRQGAWTDLYALGATLQYLLTQAPPAPATARMVHDDAPLLSATERPGVSVNFLRIVDWMLAPRPADRPQSVAELRDALAGRTEPPVRVMASEPVPSQWQRTEIVPRRTSVTSNPPPAALPAAELLQPAAVPPAAPRPPRPPLPPSLPVTAFPPLAPRKAALPPDPPPRRRAVLLGVAIGALLLAGAGALLLKRGTGQATADVPAAASSAAATVAATPASAANDSPAPAAATVALPTAVAAVVVPPASVARSASLPVETIIATMPASAVRRAASAPRPATSTAAVPAVPYLRPIPPSAPALADAGSRPIESARPPSTPPSRASTAVVAAPQEVRDPREQCGNRILLAMHLCLMRECDKPQYRDHRQCQLVRDIEERAKQRPS